MSTKIWIILLSLTILTFLLGYFKLQSPLIIGVLLVSILIKGLLISDNFMGLKEVELQYRIIPILWLCIVLSLVGFTYYF